MTSSSLPPEYAGWNATERIGFWTGLLYRQMRWAGEDGLEEITILDAPLLARMREDDPGVDALLPFVLVQLSRMWMTQPGDFVARVNAQMGTDFRVPTGRPATQG